MKTIHKTINLKTAEDVVRFRNISDIHLGNMFCNTSNLDRVCKEIASDDSYYWFGGGDYAEFIDYRDRRFRAAELDKRLHGQDDLIATEVKMLGEYFKPIASKNIAWVEGNHENQASNYLNRDIIGEVRQASGLKKDNYLGFRGFAIVHFKLYGKIRYTMTFFITHGTGSSRLPSGHAGYLNRFFQSYSADIFMAGHRHICMTLENPILVPRGTGCEQRIQHAMVCGSFMTGKQSGHVADNYSDRAEYVPNIPGGYEIIVQPGKRSVSVSRVAV